MDFGTARREQLGIKSLGDKKRSGEVKGGVDVSKFVKGPEEFDCLNNAWSRGELLGIVADSGVGKTEFVLDSMKSVLKNNPGSNAVFVSLEMTDDKIANRWFAMTEDDPELADRLYIISRYDENGKSKPVSMDWIKSELDKYQAVIGDVIIFAIDHLHIIGENDVSSLNSIVVKVKEMCVQIDAFGMLLAQVSKTAGKKGEVPLDADSVYGCSQFKWIATDIIQLHRPIKRYESDADISVLGYGYAKIREPHINDKLKAAQNKLLKYDLATRRFMEMNNSEYTIFKMWYNELLVARGLEEKHSAHEYDITKEIQGSDGRMVVIREKFSGDVGDDL